MTMVDMPYNAAYTLLENGSLVGGAVAAYQVAWGVYFWPILTIALLGLVAIKTESAGLVAVMAIIAHIIMWNYLPVQTEPIFYITIVLAIGFTVYTFYASNKTT